MPKDVYLTDRNYKTSCRAKTYLQLKEKPTHQIEIDPKNVPNRTPLQKVKPDENPEFGKGGGTESVTKDSIPVERLNLKPLK